MFQLNQLVWNFTYFNIKLISLFYSINSHNALKENRLAIQLTNKAKNKSRCKNDNNKFAAYSTLLLADCTTQKLINALLTGLHDR